MTHQTGWTLMVGSASRDEAVLRVHEETSHIRSERGDGWVGYKPFTWDTPSAMWSRQGQSWTWARDVGIKQNIYQKKQVWIKRFCVPFNTSLMEIYLHWTLCEQTRKWVFLLKANLNLKFKGRRQVEERHLPFPGSCVIVFSRANLVTIAIDIFISWIDFVVCL